MKISKAKMFNKEASDPKNKPDQILKAIALQPGQCIVDIGAGGGYYSLRFAESVGRNGLVYAVDINPEFLEFISISAKEKGLKNINMILSKEDRLTLPEKSLDWVYMRNSTHHLQNRVEYFRNIKRLLKSGGRIAIIDYKRGGFFKFRWILGHYLSQGTIVNEMEQAGYQLKAEFNFLPEQSFTVFTIKE